jgi:hypothetical protein
LVFRELIVGTNILSLALLDVAEEHNRFINILDLSVDSLVEFSIAFT